MAYYNEVLILVAVKTPQQADELMAVYAMDPRVQKEELASKWTRHERTDMVVLRYYHNSTRWNEGFGYADGLRHLCTLAETFSSERGFEQTWADEHGDTETVPMFPFAWLFYRIGENTDDIEWGDNASCHTLQDTLFDCAHVERRIVDEFAE